jgi:hypothetical protein
MPHVVISCGGWRRSGSAAGFGRWRLAANGRPKKQKPPGINPGGGMDGIRGLEGL